MLTTHTASNARRNKLPPRPSAMNSYESESLPEESRGRTPNPHQQERAQESLRENEEPNPRRAFTTPRPPPPRSTRRATTLHEPPPLRQARTARGGEGELLLPGEEKEGEMQKEGEGVPDKAFSLRSPRWASRYQPRALRQPDRSVCHACHSDRHQTTKK
ncbi:hypothetical protein Taro_035704 [Colocasia esculenta]|uniref:Uncharacterized protein n=1 Tax=Colocasia esculenta TaxID=4460 RepID=A0A843VV87_COLES|nr:hypothetical protein [Colocasia esculenta]